MKDRIVKWLLSTKVLEFGDFTLKSGRKSKYFFNLGKIFGGEDLEIMSDYYCEALQDAGLIPDVVFGPAYKGIPLAVSTAQMSNSNRDGNAYAYCFDRKEEKDHGDGGKLVGAPLKDKEVVIIDDVITSGGSIIEAAEKIEKHGGKLTGVVVFIDRMEATSEQNSKMASDNLREQLGVPVIPVLTIEEIVNMPSVSEQYPEEAKAIQEFLNG